LRLRSYMRCALSKLCLYGTVLNSVDTVERSIRSVFRPDADIVITDGGSRDGTYERLLEISKDYNLRVYRAPGSSRGLGRQIALARCPEGSYTAYFDLDDEYNEYFHRSIDWGVATGSSRPLYYLYNREYLLSRGGWGDLNFAEDFELWARAGFDYYLPVIYRARMRGTGARSLADYELKRYARGTWGSFMRTVRHQVDLVRGLGYSLGEYLREPAFRRRPYLRPAAALMYGVAYIKGIKRYDKRFNNHDLFYYVSLQKLVDPVKELKADERYVSILVKYETALNLGLSWVAKRLAGVGLRPYICKQERGSSLAGLKDLRAIDIVNTSVYYRLLTCRPLEEASLEGLGQVT